MAVDLQQVVVNLRGFYDFTDRVLLSVGAGGGQLLDVYRDAARILAVDCDAEALRRFGEAVSAKGLENRMRRIQADFNRVVMRVELVLFEFSLHEMPGPERALLHARSLATEVVVFDHAVGSEWAYYVDEEEKVCRSTQAIERLGIERRAAFRGEQRFADHAELLAKVTSQGPTAVLRAADFRDRRDIKIHMDYMAVLL